MKRSGLDKIDVNILKTLQDNGRVTNVELAKDVGISAPPCLRRVRALEDAGYISGYNAQINPALMGYSVTVFAMVKLKSQSDEALKVFDEHINALPMVRECFMIAGDFDYMLKIVAKSWDEYQEFLTKSLTSAPSVDAVKSSLSMRNVKQLPGIPIE